MIGESPHSSINRTDVRRCGIRHAEILLQLSPAILHKVLPFSGPRTAAFRRPWTATVYGQPNRTICRKP